jgi:hypothetical protein
MASDAEQQAYFEMIQAIAEWRTIHSKEHHHTVEASYWHMMGAHVRCGDCSLEYQQSKRGAR